MALSEKLADLSRRAKKVEDDFAAAKSDAKEKIQARVDQLHSKMDSDAKAIKDKIGATKRDASAHAVALKNKIDSDIAGIKQKLADTKHKIDANIASDRADLYEADAEDAVNYAIFAIDQAEIAVLDALAARSDAKAKA